MKAKSRLPTVGPETSWPILSTESAQRKAQASEAVAKLRWLGAVPQTVRLYGKALQQRQVNFATAS
jgi:hypothetical protein